MTEKDTATEVKKLANNVIDQAIEQRQAETFLLEGITGSGKTEVYLHACARQISFNACSRNFIDPANCAAI